MKGKIAIFLCSLLAACTVLTACGGTNEEKPPEEINLKPIAYESSINEQKRGGNVDLILPSKSEWRTGNELTAYVSLGREIDNYNYYLVDWGDGTWSYNGPYQYGNGYTPLGEVRHTYKRAGVYSVKAAAVNLAAGTLYGWTDAKEIAISGDAYEGSMIKSVRPIASSQAEGYSADKIADNDNATYWKNKEAQSAVTEEYVGYLFDDYYTLHSIEIKTPGDMKTFPSNIAIEYTTDGGETWYSLPRYYYVMPTANGKYSIVMGFPNPAGATLVLPLDGIAANGIRISSKLFSPRGGRREFGVSELRVYGDRELIFYTSEEGSYNADLSNMWTIFGTARTEPIVQGSLRGSAPNVRPFRSGTTMIASTEWFMWDSDQLVWSGYDEAINILVNAMKNSRYGGDGWYYDAATDSYVVDETEYRGDSASGLEENYRDDGYIWATDSDPRHFEHSDLLRQNHYTTNSSLIIGARNYLLTANGTAGFLSSENAQGQVMLEKLRKAADYLLNALNGRSGLLTIYDPRNAGTVDSVSSNYWDSLPAFGYQSSYENILFYRAMQCMADIENFVGNTEKANEYLAYTRLIKQKFNETFWDEEKGRYITSINVDGDRLDFGYTFTNFMATYYGLADEARLKSIYDWVDGNRIIETDTSKGEDIYNFTVSARSNTVAIESVYVNDSRYENHYYWAYEGTDNDVTSGKWGEYGNQMQNGGSIFYISHYDVGGRVRMDPDNAAERFRTILEEFHKDELRRDPDSAFSVDAGGGFLLSICGEFPESGLVPLTFLKDFVGISAEVQGLRIDASLPSDMDYAGVGTYHYNNKIYNIRASRKVSSPTIELKNGKYYVVVPADKAYYITLSNEVVAA